MKDYGRIRGSKAQAIPLIVGKDTVYVHSDIVEIDENESEYNEVQYGKDEYIKLISEKNDTQESVINELMFEIIPTMIGGE